MDEIFRRAGCEGAVCVEAIDGDGGFRLRADQPVVPASVVKVQIALEAETWFADGRLDPAERNTLAAADHVPGPVGLSLFADDVTISSRDLVTLALTISDNTATDALLHRLGTDAVNTTAARLGLTDTILVNDVRTTADSLGHHLGRAGWNDLIAWSATASAAEIADAHERLLTAPALDPRLGTRTTPQDMTRLLRLIWTDRAGPPAACARIRSTMARQLTRHRIASGFRPPARVAAKSGGLAGVVRNEVGVVTEADGRRYAVAVFTRARPGADDSAINAAIGAAAAEGVASSILR